MLKDVKQDQWTWESGIFPRRWFQTICQVEWSFIQN